MTASTSKGLDELRRARRQSRGLYWAVGLFSFFANMLMLTGPLYMMQVYDRVLGSRSEATLVALSLLVVFLYGIMGLLDFARGRMGGGIPVKRLLVDDLGPILEQALREVQMSNPEAHIHHLFNLQPGIYCDSLRITQLLSNLVGNAVIHGAKASLIEARAWCEGPDVVISVTNQGPPIAEHLMPLLFEPFTRSEAGHRGEGLGLGLYIAYQIAEAHGGTLEVTSTLESGTVFVARFPSIIQWVY